MARYSASQIRSMLRQAQQRQRQAIDKYNQSVRRYSQELRRAVSQYNREVVAHNSRVRAHRQRIAAELARMGQQRNTRLSVYQTSVQSLYRSYVLLDRRADAHSLGTQYDYLVDLSERETANSLQVTNSLLGLKADEPTAVIETADSHVLQKLVAVSSDLEGRWRGAVFALSPENPDAARHFCTSAREILTAVIDRKAPDEDVLAALPGCATTDTGRPTRRSKLRYMLLRNGMDEQSLGDFAEEDINNLLELFRVFNDGTHGSSGRYDMPQLAAIKSRVEQGIFYLTEIANQ